MLDFYYRMIDDESFCITKCVGTGDTAIIPTNIKVTVLFDDLFKERKDLVKVVIPDTVTQIGGFVFDGCVNLKEVILPPKLKDMWQYAMTRCGIERIEIPGTVESIIPFTFFKCENLKEVVLNEGTKRIYAWAFKDCTALRDVYLPASIEIISDKAFEGCNNIILHEAK
ncbi:MAG: hypothetical protein A2Y17_00135 [Clostridiales bacterium GWF2_38_85]|nr:MAG: hypothetical protein A2Y17_00135 [Clostridiales bacterium GWF2_38_85]